VRLHGRPERIAAPVRSMNWPRLSLASGCAWCRYWAAVAGPDGARYACPLAGTFRTVAPTSPPSVMGQSAALAMPVPGRAEGGRNAVSMRGLGARQSWRHPKGLLSTKPADTAATTRHPWGPSAQWTRTRTDRSPMFPAPSWSPGRDGHQARNGSMKLRTMSAEDLPFGRATSCVLRGSRSRPWRLTGDRWPSTGT
jgi:hypothetical protein